MKSRYQFFVGLLLCAAMGSVVRAAPADPLDWWREARFGMFIHWGPVSLKGTEIGWSRGRQVPEKEYDQLYKKFNPVKFSADEWVSIAKQTGMKYLVITSKHHDGFSIWDSKQTDYDIMSSPFKRDILTELSKACVKHGIRFCFYYSICDWYHPDYPMGSPGGRTAKSSPNMPRYVRFLHAQLEELIKGYGPIGIVWFDGEWEKPWTVKHGDELYELVKKLQPGVIINNRVNKARRGMAGSSREDIARPGDYDTPEQRIGSFNRDRPWETCMTLCRQWAWKPDDRMKSLSECLRTLISTVGGDGNLLFNVGPMPDGRIEPRQVERLMEMGAWLEKHDDTIYGTRGGPFKPGTWGASTCKGNTINLFVMKWPAAGVLQLPAIDSKIAAATLSSGAGVDVEQDADGIRIRVPEAHRDDIATIIRLQVNGKAFAITPVAVPATPSGSLAFGKSATASNTFQGQKLYGPVKAIDDDPETRWATDSGTSAAWLEVDLGSPATIGRVAIDEHDWDRIQQFELQYKAGEQWKTALAGTTVGAKYSKRFGPVSARHFRLNILKASDGPTIWEFRLFAK